MPTEEELKEKIKALESQLETSQKEITKWKYKFNSKNADYVLLHGEFEKYKRQRNLWPWLITLILASLTLYFYYLSYEK